MFSGRLASFPSSAFQRLNRVLGDITPESFAYANAPVALTIGEPQDPTPAFIADIVNGNRALFAKYPPVAGTASFRAAVARWLARRFSVPLSAFDADTQILPLNGSREGLFHALFPLCQNDRNGGKPVVLIPNPYYVTYPAAAVAAGAEPYYVPSRAETGFLPDFNSVPEAILKRTVAAFFCSPSNPEGGCATREQWRRVFELADLYDFTVLADECYCEIYDDEPPLGSLQVRYETTGGFERLLSFHSLSKRSNAPGLRSGFVFGPKNLIGPMTLFRNTCAPQVPIPVMEASAAAWSDEAHVEAMRAVYRERFAIARRLLGNQKGFRVPKGSFYIWLDVGDGEAFAKTLWRKAGVRVLPGAFMGLEQIPGNPASNPGHAYVRIALVHDSLTIEAALERVAETLKSGT